jgi:hypothetical protein
VINDFAATNFGLTITHDFDDQSCALSTIYPRLLKKVVNRSQAWCDWGFNVINNEKYHCVII